MSFAEYKRQQDEENELIRRAEAVRMSGLASQGYDPDKYAEAEKVGRQTGIPTRALYNNLDKYKQKLQIDDAVQTGESSPRLKQFLSDPDHYAQAKDDLESLRRIDDTDNWLDILKDWNRISGSLLASGTLDIGKGTIQLGRDVERLADQHPFWNIVNRGRRALLDQIVPDLDAIENIERTQKEYLPSTQDALSFDDALEEGRIGRFIAEQLPAAGAHFVGAVGAAPAYWSSLMAQFANDRAKNDGRDEATAGDYGVAAVTVAIIKKMEEFSAAKILGQAGRKLFPKLKIAPKTITPPKGKAATAAQVVREGLKGTASEGTMEALQGGVENLGTRAFTEKGVDLEDLAKDMAAEGLVGGAFGGGVRTGTSYAEIVQSRTEQHINNVVSSGMEDAGLDEMITLMQESNLLKRNPEAMAEFIGENRQVFADQEAVQELADAGVELPADVQAQLDGTGGKVSILMRDFLTNEEMRTKLRDSVSLREEGLSRKDIKEDQAGYVETLIRDANKAANENTEIDEIFGEVTEQLIMTNRMASTEARRNAALISAYVSTKAKNLGITPMEFYQQRMRFRVVGPDQRIREQTIPAGMDVETEKARLDAVTSMFKEGIATQEQLDAAKERYERAKKAFDEVPTGATRTLVDQQDFGDMEVTETKTIAETGEEVEVKRSMQKEWDIATERKVVAQRVKDCLNA